MKEIFRGELNSEVKLVEPRGGELDWGLHRRTFDTIRLRQNGQGASEEVIAELKSRIRDETDFRNSKAVETAWRRLIQAKETNGITALEMRRNRFLRKEEIEYLRNDGSSADSWSQRTTAILEFHRLLESRGISLLFMPVPNQADMEMPRLVGVDQYQSSSPQHTSFLVELAEAGVEVIDLRYDFGARVLRGENMINRFDHHWSPQGIEIGADHLARRILALFDGLPKDSLLPFEFSTIYLEEPVLNFPHRLVRGKGSPLFARQVLLQERPVSSWPDSRILLIGDSMVLSFAPPVSADLGSHLAARLGYPCRVIGKGSGSPLVPRMFIEAYGFEASPEDPDVVVWVCISRHQEYFGLDGEGPDHEDSGLSDSLYPGSHSVLVRGVSEIPDPRTAPYPNALFTCEVTIEPEAGAPVDARVYAPAFQSRKRLASSRIKVGETHRMNLRAWQEAQKENLSLRRSAVIDDFSDFRLPEYFWNGE
ncbi:MAG: hypothetical protein AAGC68_03605 [Verrucomicrobiota bacterium]